MGQERRFKRFNVEIMNITGRIALSTVVRIKELDSRGVNLCADVRLDIGKEHNLRLGVSRDSLLLKGVVESSSLSESLVTAGNERIPLYCAYIRFKPVTPDVEELLEVFVKLYREDEEQNLSRLRLSVDDSERASVDIGEDCKVKKISLGGMLIECGNPQERGRNLPMVISLTGQTPLHITGRVASCLPVGDGEDMKYDIGVEFKDMSPTDKERLKEFIRLLESSDDAHPDLWKQEKIR